MKSLRDLYGPNSCVHPDQAQYFFEEVNKRLQKELSSLKAAEIALRELYRIYDLGGISYGRCVRSALLEKIDLPIHESSIMNSRKNLSLLCGMYHDTEFVTKRSCWYDYKIENYSDTTLIDRILLGVAVTAFEIENEIVDVSQWSNEKINMFVST